MTTTAVAIPDLAAPDFALPTHLGGEFRLASRAGAGPTVLVFYRGHWCPYCRRYLSKLQTIHPRLAEHGTAVVAVSPEPLATSRALAADLGLGFPLLCDAAGTVIDRYGCRNGFCPPSVLLPHPAVLVLDANLTIRFRSIDRNYKRRTTMRTILAAVDAARA